MKRATHLSLATAALAVTLSLTVGCEHHDAMLQYNPQVDSVLPTYLNSPPDMGILDDQRKVHDNMVAAVHAAPAAPAAPAGTPAPASAPATGATPPAPPA